MIEKIAAPIEFTDAYFTVSTLTDGRLTVKLQGHPIASLPGIQYGFVLKEGTTRRQAEKLSEMLGQHCDVFFAGFLDRIKDEEFRGMVERDVRHQTAILILTAGPARVTH